MRRSLITGAALAAGISLAGCTQLLTTSLPDRPVDETFYGRSIEWSSGEQLTFAYMVFDSAGQVGLCGARAASPGGHLHQRTFNERAVQSSYLTLGGDILVNDISFFREGRFVRDAMPVGQASCVRTREPWRAAYAEEGPVFEQAKSRFVIYD